MNFNKKSLAGVGAVAIAAVYGLVHWQSGADDDSEEVTVTEEQVPAAD